MSGQWKPGDVAMIEVGCHANRRVAIRTGVPSNMGWAYSGTHDGKSTQDWISDKSGIVSVVRPLVVIDPDGPEVNRLVTLLGTSWSRPISELRTALRSLIAPPRPDEPTGLGAVVEDAEGRRWVRWQEGPRYWVGRPGTSAARYAEIAAVRVLSEGVQ